MRFVEQNTHQFGNRHGRMRIIKLDGNLVPEASPVGVVAAVAADKVGQPTRPGAVFLEEAQALSLAGGVIGIENAGYRLGSESTRQGLCESATAEFLKIEVVGRSGRP